MSFIVAIDGPAGSGKGTLAKEISRLTDLINIDTGATYRCVTLAAIQKGYTLEEIGQEIGKSRSYISELLNLHDIKTTDIEGRQYAMKQRRKMLESRPFIDVMYDKIKNEK